ncbi:MAG: septum formation initiator family protein [Bacteroidales bacterium]|nr:septum formation initiator family protein [Bacteroidales bacterium]
MGKIKDIYKGPHRNFAWFATITTGLFLVFWLVGSGNTFIHWAKAGAEIRRQKKLIRSYELQNAEMEQRINMIRTDKDTLEKFAREHFNFAVPGEDVYVID